MKKALSFLLTLVMVLTVVAAGAFSVDAAENLFLRFDDLIAYVLSIGNKADIDSNDIGYWTFCQYDSVYGDDYTTGRWENGKFNAVRRTVWDWIFLIRQISLRRWHIDCLLLTVPSKI